MEEKPTFLNEIIIPVRFASFEASGPGYLKYPITQLNSQIRYGPPVDANFPAPGPGTEVYVSGIPPDHNLSEIFKLFAQAGIIHTARFVISFR